MEPIEKMRQWLFKKFFKKQIQEIKSKLQIESRHQNSVISRLKNQQKCLKDDLKDLQARYDKEKDCKQFYIDRNSVLKSQIDDLKKEVKQLNSQLSAYFEFNKEKFEVSLVSKHSREIEDLKNWISERDAKIQLLETEINQYKHNNEEAT